MYLELAQKYLIKARSTSGPTRQYFANLCQVCLTKEGAKPEDIGVTLQDLAAMQTKIEQNNMKTSKREVNEMAARQVQQTKKQLTTCQRFLDQCRQAQGASRQYYANLCLSEVAKHGVRLEQIGTSESELQELQIKGLLESARNYLTEARNAKGAKRKCYADLCWEYLSKAKAKPSDIGASEEELQKMTV